MESELIIEKNGREISSKVTIDAEAGVIAIESRIGGLVHGHTMTVHPHPGYSAEQLEYDVDQARHRAADTLLGTVEVQALLEASKPAAGAAVRRVTGPQVRRPEKRP